MSLFYIQKSLVDNLRYILGVYSVDNTEQTATNN